VLVAREVNGGREMAEKAFLTNDGSDGSAAQRVLVVGLGHTGLSCARFLHRQGQIVAVTDDRMRPPELPRLRAELPNVAVFVGGFAPEAFARAARIVVSPGVSPRTPALVSARDRGVPVIGDIDLFADAARAPIVAVTGSNGKSTVTTLVGHMAECAGRTVRTGGNLGPPALELLGSSEPELYVLELSSFQLESNRAPRSRAAVVLNVSADHMDRHHDLAEYAAHKQRIYRDCGVMVINRDDPWVARMGQSDRPSIGFTLGVPAQGDFGLRTAAGAEWLSHGSERLLDCRALRVAGRHNLANALAALALGEALDLPVADRLEALRTFPGLPHRTQWVAESAGVQWYDDSKATNVGACLAALEGMPRRPGPDGAPGRIVLIAGGQGKGADFRALRAAVCSRVRSVVLIGEDAAALEAALGAVVPIHHADDMEQAVRQAEAVARPGDTVLLAPACASFDMFDGFDHRGRVFVDAVRRLSA